MYDEDSEKVLGFWDMMMKQCFLFTATTEKYMEDIMHKLFNVKASEFINYRVMLS